MQRNQSAILDGQTAGKIYLSGNFAHRITMQLIDIYGFFMFETES